MKLHQQLHFLVFAYKSRW